MGLAALTLVGLTVAGALLRPPEVELVAVEERDMVETLLTTGRVTVRGTRSLATEVGGRVSRVGVDEGDSLVAGQVLVELDARDAQWATLAASASLAEAEARMDGLRSRLRPVALVRLEEARLELERTERELERATSLLARGLGTEQGVDAARDAHQAARLAERRAATEVRALGSDGAEVLMALQQVERLRAEVERVRHREALHALAAPIAGRVASRDVEEGEVVAAGRTLLVLTPDNGVEIRVQPDERELARLSVGQRAWVASEVLGSVPLAARVDRVLPAVDPQRGTADVRLVLDEVPGEMRPNLTVDVEIELAHLPAQPVVPHGALREEDGSAWVLGVEDGRLVRRDVEVGWRGRDGVALVRGVRVGERVVADAADRHAGRRVRERSGTPASADDRRGGAP